MAAYASILLATTLLCIALIASRRWHGRFSLDGTVGVQKHHCTPTPRIGGVAIAWGMVLAWACAESDARAILGPMLLAGIPAFASGLIEDVTKRVSVRTRLLATMFSGTVAWYLTGVAMQNTGLAPLDAVLAFAPVAVLFTAFAVGGMANAINIIDGFNGLASGSVAIMSAALGVIAGSVGDMALSSVCFAVTACAVGFGLVNWPYGKIFLGDGGAYLLGFMLAWLAVLLPMRHTQITAWTTLLVCAYPVIEVGFSVRRRQRRHGHHLGQPDKAHLHHFLHRRLVTQWFPSVSKRMQNGLTSPLCWLATALPALWAVAFAQSVAMLSVGMCLAIFGYGAVYARFTQFRWCLQAWTLRQPDADEPLVMRKSG